MKNLSYLTIFCLNVPLLHRLLPRIRKAQQLMDFSLVYITYLLDSPSRHNTNCLIFRVNACDKEEKYQGLVEEFSRRVYTSVDNFPCTLC
jgi:hypothetical protein